MNKDIIKGVVYDRGEATQNGEKRYLSLVCLVIASKEPLTAIDKEFVVMGAANISEEIGKLQKYECPYKFGDISNAIINVSRLSPDSLEEIEPE